MPKVGGSSHSTQLLAGDARLKELYAEMKERWERNVGRHES